MKKGTKRILIAGCVLAVIMLAIAIHGQYYIRTYGQSCGQELVNLVTLIDLLIPIPVFIAAALYQKFSRAA